MTRRHAAFCYLSFALKVHPDRHTPPRSLSLTSQDLWTQIGRFARLTKIGTIQPDLANYDDEAAGGSAWPCAIDDFVEFVQQGDSSS